MNSLKTDILQEFDQIILDLETLLRNMPDQSLDHILMSRGYEPTPKDQKDTFYTIRSRYLKLLMSIPSRDEKLQSAINHVRDVSPVRFNLERILEGMRELKSDYEAGVLGATNSSGDSIIVIEQMLLEARHEVEHFQPPYSGTEIDRIENVIKRAVRAAFGEESSHYKNIHQIFHPIASVSFVGQAPEIKLQRHIEKWQHDRERLINAVKIMPDEFRLNERRRQEVESKKNQQIIADSHHNSRWLDEPKAIIIAALIGGLFLIFVFFLGRGFEQSNSSNTLTNNSVILTYTPPPTATINITSDSTITPSATDEATSEQ
jgi:hypothetical protein